MIDKFLLAPYWLTLKMRHGLYNKGIRKTWSCPVPTISIGNITVGGTGKTPHTEMLLKTLLDDDSWRGRSISVLSRGYKRESRGFQQVTLSGTAAMFGDEPLQIKKKFPFVTVAVDKNRVEGCGFLTDPATLGTSKKARRCMDKEIDPSDLIILDDAFQYRSLKPTISIVLVDYNRPVFKDHLMPLGRLRDLPERLKAADIVIVTKCPAYMEEEEQEQWRKDLGIEENQDLFFTTVNYCPMEPVYPEGESRYLYAKRLVLFTGIANDRPMMQYLSGNYKVVRHLTYPDHHKYTNKDIRNIQDAAKEYPTSVVVTTEKDSHRVKDCQKASEELKQRLFRLPIQVGFLNEEEQARFKEVILRRLTAQCPESGQTPRE